MQAMNFLPILKFICFQIEFSLAFVAGTVSCSSMFGPNDCILAQKGQLYVVNYWTIH